MISLVKILAPLILGLIGGILKANSEAKNEQLNRLMSKAGFDERSRVRAGKLKGVQWTRRFLAILFSVSFVGITVVIILAGVFDPTFTINIPKEIYKHSFFSYIGFVDPVITTDYIKLSGLTLVSPLLEKLMIITEVIISFYFGSKTK